MTQPTPIRPDVITDLSTSPEALMISALLASGSFAPSSYGLTSDDLSCYEKLWVFCAEYHARSGAAPGLELVRSKFPDYVFIPGIDIDWAADQLSNASLGRQIRRGVSGILQGVADGDYELVTDLLRDIREPRRRTRALAGLSVFDPSNVAEAATKAAIPVPWQSLADATEGGVGLGELWDIGGRLGCGKSNDLVAFAGTAAERGYHVRIASLEMSAAAYNRRMARYLARHDRQLQLALKDRDPLVRGEALEQLKDKAPAGTIEVFDPSMMDLNTSSIEDICQGAHMVCIDHVGLLKLPDGTRAISDWRTMAQISNVLREINLRTGVAMVNVVQTNRESDTAGLAPPKVSQISQSDAIGQDADVVLMIKKPAATFQVHEVGKTREAANNRYYTKFDPEHADYREISKEDALNMQLADQDRNASL